MNPPDINFDNYKLLAAKNYYRVKYSSTEFEQDISSVSTIKKAITRYLNKDAINVRAILNKIIVLCNVFGPEFTVRLIFLIFPKEYYTHIAPFLKFLNILPDVVYNVDGNNIQTKTINMNNFILGELEQL